MKLEEQEAILNQFYINNVDPNRKTRIYNNPKEALADYVAKSNEEEFTGIGKDVLYKANFWHENCRSGEPGSDVYKNIFYKDSSKVKNGFNNPFDGIWWKSRIVDRSYLGHAHSKYISSGQIIDDTAERETIENNLTFNGYCTLLVLLSEKELLNYRDEITNGINNEAKASLREASDVNKVKAIHQDFLQLKAAAEFLIGRAEANYFDQGDELLSVMGTAIKDFEE